MKTVVAQQKEQFKDINMDELEDLRDDMEEMMDDQQYMNDMLNRNYNVDIDE